MTLKALLTKAQETKKIMKLTKKQHQEWTWSYEEEWTAPIVVERVCGDFFAVWRVE